MTETFPTLPGLGFPMPRTPNWDTARYEAMSGKRTFAPKMPFPRWRWELPYNFLRSAAYSTTPAYQELETLIGFFNKRSADGMAFKFVDPEDNTATDQGFGAGDGVTTQFQLYRSYGGFSEPVYAPTVDAIAIDGAPTADYTLGDTGIVTFDNAPADGSALTWTGTFAWLCRLEADVLDVRRIMQGLWETGDAVRFSNELGL